MSASAADSPLLTVSRDDTPRILDCFTASGTIGHTAKAATLYVHSDGSCVLTKARKRCGCCPVGVKVKWAAAGDVVGAVLTAPDTLQLCYMPVKHPRSPHPVRVLRKLRPLTLASPAAAAAAVDYIRRVCCPGPIAADRPARVFVIINPTSGRGRAFKTFTSSVLPVLTAAGCEVSTATTTHAGHATELVRALPPDGADVIAAVGGDGTTHEVLQGLLSRPDWDAMRTTPVVQVPCGSGNALAASVGLWNAATAAHAITRRCVSRLDVASVVQPGQPRRFAFLSLTYGVIPCLDLGTEGLRCLGELRFTLGGIREVVKDAAYGVRLAYLEHNAGESTSNEAQPISSIEKEAGRIEAVHGGAAAKEETAGSQPFECGDGPPLRHLAAFSDLLRPGAACTLANRPLPPHWTLEIEHRVQLFAACNLPKLSMSTTFAPAARPDSGHLDLIFNAGPTGRVRGLKILLASEQGHHMPYMQHRAVTALVLEPLAVGKTWVVVDGEGVDHGVTAVEVHPGLCACVVAPPLVQRDLRA